DLERYQRLHEKADGQRKGLRTSAEVLKAQLTALPEVSELEVAAVENRIADAEERRQQAAAEVERRQGLEVQAQRWAELQTRLSGLRQKRQESQALVAEAEAIEKDMARLAELRAVLPQVEAVFKHKQQAQQADTKMATLRRECQEFDTKVAERTQAVEQTKQK